MSNLVLGLDLGPNSIGWALVNDDPQDSSASKLINLGVRVFPEGVDNFDSRKEKSRNEGRRKARAMRRQIARRARRRELLRDALIESTLWPTDTASQEELYRLNPYELRTRALDQRLTLHEFGRILLHINQRRGFKSNKKEEAKADAAKARRRKSEKIDNAASDAEKKTEDILLEMEELEKSINESGARTLGEYLYRKGQALKHFDRSKDDFVRGRHTKRRMLVRELERIWNEQSKHYPDVLTDSLLYGKLGKQKDIQRPIPKWDERRSKLSVIKSFGLYGLIFFHRTLKPVPKEIVGACELESNQRRCARADRRAQYFRLLQEINNLEYIDPNAKDDCRLDDHQRAVLLEHLATREKITFDDIRKKFGFHDSIKFNLEKGKRSSIKGMETDWIMAKSVGKHWHKLSKDIKDGIVAALIESVDDDETHAQLIKKYGLNPVEADAALGAELPAGYLKLSLVAINKLLPHMEKGLLYEHRDPARSARSAAQYDERWALQKRLFGRLPNPQRTKPADCPIADIPNPVVKRALVELRKVVNAIIRAFGRPDEIHVEMGRDVKTRPKDKTSPAYWKYKQEEDEKAERERKRTAAKDKLRENGIPLGAAGRNIEKYLLWEEQDKTCIYSGKCISLSTLFTDEIEIDHILHLSHSLDNSLMNKVVCFRSENHGPGGKGQRTPRGWLEHSNPTKYDAVCQRAKKLPYAKFKRFLRKDAKLQDFIERQLNDNRYIAKATAEYLKCLFDFDDNKRGAVLGLKGQLTSTLRRHWGLDTILEELPDSPAWQERETGKLRPGQKNRADHRHHAIDAVILAMTNHRQLERLASGFTVREFVSKSTGNVEYKSYYQGDRIDLPWKTFRDEVAHSISQINGHHLGVSHRVQRKVAGAMHADSLYWPTSTSGEYVKRKPIVDLSVSEIEEIRDKTIKRLVINSLTKVGIECDGEKKLSKAAKLTMKQTLSNIKMESGVPVRRIRLKMRDKTICPIRKESINKAYVKPSSTHHLCIFAWDENGKTKRGAVFVTMLEAIDRIKKQQQELSQQIKMWAQSGLSKSEIKQRQRTAMRALAIQHPVIQRDASKLDEEAAKKIPRNARCLMSISNGELALLEIDGQTRLAKMRTSKSTEDKLVFCLAEDARKEYRKIRVNINTLFTKYRAKKVTVDPLGRIRWAND